MGPFYLCTMDLLPFSDLRMLPNELSAHLLLQQLRSDRLQGIWRGTSYIVRIQDPLMCQHHLPKPCCLVESTAGRYWG